jgi:hypothetical protein
MMDLLRCGTIARDADVPKASRREERGMSASAYALRPPSKTLMLLEGRALHELGAFVAALPLLSFAPRGDGHPVLVLPGLVASDVSTRPLRTFLEAKGYAVSG